MNRFKHLYILLPCHSLEDFPVHYTGDEASELLHLWTSLWHPNLISQSRSTPKWHRAEALPDDLEHALILLPSVSQHMVPDGLRAECHQKNGTLVEGISTREAIVEKVLHGFDSPEPASSDRSLDFLALGYAFLQIQLMTRQLRYSSNLDEDKFRDALVAAATDSSEENAESHLQRCFDMLLEEKNRYYPVQANLLDYTLLASTTLGKSLRDQLARPIQQNLLMTGAIANVLASEHPKSLEAIKTAISDQRVELMGGYQTELPDPMVGMNSIIRNLSDGLETIQSTFDFPVKVFARRTTGLSATHPEILEKLSFQAAIHATLDEGRFPTTNATNIRWESPSGEMITALSQIPVDAMAAETFLNLGVRIGEAIDADHHATIVFAHWPNRFSPFFEDVLRIHRYGALFGDFVSLEDYFSSVYDPGFGETNPAGEYRNAYLKQAVAAKQLDPISRYVDYWRRTAQVHSLENLALIVSVRQGLVPLGTIKEIESLGDQVDRSLADADSSDSVDEVLQQVQSRLLERLSDSEKSECNSEDGMTTLLNTVSFSRRVRIDDEGKHAKPSGEVGPILLRDVSGGSSVCIANAPTLGQVQVDVKKTSKRVKRSPSVVEDNKLRNEYFEVSIDPKTGGMRGLRLYNRRSNLVTQKLAMRKFSGHPNLDRPVYSEMVADSVRLEPITHLAGRATAIGSLVMDKKVVAKFEQTLTVCRGQRKVHFQIEIDALEPLPDGQAWDHYYCSRLAWLEEAATLTRDVHSTRHSVDERRICAPNYIDISEPDYKLTYVTGGIPFHQRVGRRQLDSLLVVPGETRKKFEFAIYVNHPYSKQAYLDWITPPVVLKNTRLGETSSNWLFHFSSKNIVSTLTRPISNDDGKLVGVHFRLQETAGRRGDLHIHCPYQVKRALLVNLKGDPREELKCEGSKVVTDFLASQMFDVHIFW